MLLGAEELLELFDLLEVNFATLCHCRGLGEGFLSEEVLLSEHKFVLHGEHELVHIKVAEEGVLHKEVDGLHVFQSQKRQAMRWAVYGVAKQKSLKVLVGLVFREPC